MGVAKAHAPALKTFLAAILAGTYLIQAPRQTVHAMPRALLRLCTHSARAGLPPTCMCRCCRRLRGLWGHAGADGGRQLPGPGPGQPGPAEARVWCHRPAHRAAPGAPGLLLAAHASCPRRLFGHPRSWAAGGPQCGCLQVLVCGAELFTSNAAMLPAAVYEGRATLLQLLRNWGLAYSGAPCSALRRGV